MTYAHSNAIVDGAWLARHLDDPLVRIVDASWYLPSGGRDGRTEYQTRHIPGAVFFDVDAIARTDTDLPHMLPNAAEFAAAVAALGIGNQHRVIVYDGHGIYSAPRVWWSFRAFGHDAVAVLAGGLPQWLRDGHPVTAATTTVEPAQFTARFRPDLVAACADVQANLGRPEVQVLDARSPGRFAGTEPELRAGVRSGHIPGAVNLHYTEILDNSGATYLAAAPLREILADRGVTDGPVTTSCGSGITACILALGLHLVGHDAWRVYDGSWTEWGSRPDTPVAVGQDSS